MLLWWRDLPMLGPFTFYDETTYFQLARNVWEHFNYAGQTSYNPLYSLVMAPLFALHAETSVYSAVRILNVLLWTSSLFPVLWLARRWLKGFWVPLAIAVATVFMPLSATVPLVRAEPLFFPLFCLCVWLGLRMLEEDKPQWGMLSGLAAGLLFLTKQGGLALVLALAIMSVACWWRAGRPATRVRTFVSFLASFFLLSTPWLVRNRLLGQGMVGYTPWVQKMLSGALSLKLLHGFGLNLTYVFLAFWGGLFVIYIFSLAELPKLSWEEQILGGFTAAVLVSELLFGALISVVLPEHQNRTSFLPTGRYIDNSFPLICVFVLRVAGRHPGMLLRRLPQTLLIWLAGCVAIYYYSPIQAVIAKSAAENPSLSYLTPLFAPSGGNWWDLPRIVTQPQRWMLVLGMAALAGPFLLVRGRRELIPLFCAGSIILGWASAVDIHNVALATRASNLAAMWLVNREVPVSQIVFDAKVQPLASPFGFWLQGALFQNTLQVATPTEVLLPGRFTFGPIDTPIKKGDIRIPAPWRGEALFDATRGFGFRPSDLANLRSNAVAGGTPQDAPMHYIFGTDDSHFQLVLPPRGHFMITADTSIPSAQASLPVDFVIAAGHEQWRVKRSGLAVQAHVSLGTYPPGEVDIEFRPRANSVWAINTLDVIETDPLPNRSARYFVSLAPLPLPEAYRADPVHIYDLAAQPH